MKFLFQWQGIKHAPRKLVLGTLIAFGALSSINAQAQMANGQQKFLGNVIAGSVPSSFSTYWNQVTPENSGKWGSVESTRGTMNWSQLDTAYNFARSNGYTFKHHTFVWGSQEPSWIGSVSQSEQKAEIEDYMKQVCTRYPQIDFIDVVNEPLHAPASYRAALGGDGSTGWDWIIWSFQKARELCPSAKLLINEYGIINDANALNNYKKIISLLQTRGLIDGVGIQCHQFNVDTLAASTIKTNLDSLAATGLPVYVSELDITGDDQTQLARYQEKFPIFWTHPGVKGVTLWGYVQGQTWKDNTHLYNTNGTERPALTWMKGYVAGTASSASSAVRSSIAPSSVPASSIAPSSTPLSSARSSVAPSSTPSSTASGTQCNWYGTLYPLCANSASGWGWESNKSCIGSTTCSGQPAPYGIVGSAASAASSIAPSSSSRSSVAPSSTPASSMPASSAPASSKPASSSPASSAASSAASSVASTGGACSYVVTNEWNGGFTGAIRVKNNGTSAINGWNLSWSYSDGSKITNSWNATVSGSNPYTASNFGWNGTIPPGQTVEFGFQGTKGSGAASQPTVTGAACN